MANPIDELLTRPFVAPPDDDFVPANLELSAGAFVSIDDATAAQVRLAAKLHREIALRHDRLEAIAEERL
jgi:hypothetical protein